MPNLTRLAAAFLFAIAAIYMGEQYKLLYETPPKLGGLSVLLGVVGGYAGWSFVGKRIEGLLMRDIFHAVQGLIVTIALALAVYGSMEVFELGYQMRYDSLPEALVGFFDLTGVHLFRMYDRDFLILTFGTVMLIGVVLSVLFRWAERRRFNR